MLIMPPLSTTPSAPTNTMSTSSMLYATAESIKSFTGTSSLASSLDNRNPVLSGRPSAHQYHVFILRKIVYGKYHTSSVTKILKDILLFKIIKILDCLFPSSDRTFDLNNHAISDIEYVTNRQEKYWVTS